MDEFERLLTARTKIVAVSTCRTRSGTINPVATIVAMRKTAGATVLVDGAQAVSHLPVDVRALGCDFYAFSGPQALWPDWHRRALRQGESCSRPCRRTRAAAT